VLTTLLVIACVIASAIGLIVLVSLWDGLWKPEVKHDRDRLDSILARQNIDAIEVTSWDGTNTITGQQVSKLLASLQKTNRIGNIDWTKQQSQRVRFLNGTNEICCLFLGEDGAWEFGAYGFRTRR